MKLMMKTALAVACGAGLLLSAAVDQAAAASVRRVTSTASVQRLPAAAVRDHRTQGPEAKPGGISVTPLPSRRGYHDQGTPKTRRCPGTVWAGKPAACRDHRT